MKRWFRYYPLSILVVLFVTTLCLIPISDPPMKDVPFIDKWTHTLLFGGISFVLFCEFYANDNKRLLHFTPIVSGIYGGLVELAQAHLTTYRSGEWLDFWADLIGAFITYSIAILFVKWYHRRGHHNN